MCVCDFFVVTHQHFSLCRTIVHTHSTHTPSLLHWQEYLITSSNFKQVCELTRTPPPLSPPRLPSRTYTHLTVKCLWVCFVIIKWQMTLWAAATLKWNVFFKAGGNRPRKRQSRLRKFGQSGERHTHAHTQRLAFKSIFMKCSRSVEMCFSKSIYSVTFTNKSPKPTGHSLEAKWTNHSLPTCQIRTHRGTIWHAPGDVIFWWSEQLS